jgi:hypothetical protein
MNTSAPNARGYKISFVINSAVGSLLLALAVIGFVFESVFKLQRLGWGFLVPAIICLFVASLHYAKYLNLQNRRDKNE